MSDAQPTAEPSGRRMLGLLRKNRRYVENFAWLASDRAIRLVVGVVVAGMVARHLGREGYGTLNYAISVLFFFTPFATVGLHQTVMRELIKHPDKAGRLLGTTAALKLMFGGACVVALAVYATFFETGTMRWLIILVAFNLLLDASSAFDTWFESQTQSRYVAWALNSAFLTGAVLKICLIAWGAPVIWFGAVLVIQGAVGLVLKARFFHTAFPNRQGWRWSSEMVKPLLAGGLPIILLLISLTLMKRLDIFMLKKIHGLEDTGIYASAAQLSDILFMVPALIATIVLPALMRVRERDEAQFRKGVAAYFRLNAFLGYVGAIGFVLTMPLVLPLVFGDRFAEATKMAQILGIGALPLFLAISRQDCLFAEGSGSVMVRAAVVALVTNVLMNFWLIPEHGGVGAAWATVVAYFVYAILGSFLHPRTFEIGRMQLLALVKPWPGAAIAAAIGGDSENLKPKD
jgi:O-antigen/teichoic acid export membrane protein